MLGLAAHNHLKLAVLGGLFSVLALASCGAPLKRANSVKHIFSDSKELKEKMGVLCGMLRARGQLPNLNGIGMADEVCNNPGSKNAVDYKRLDQVIGFSAISPVKKVNTGSGEANAVLLVQTRSEIWLNRGILKLAQVLFNSLQSETNGLLGGKGGNGTSKNKDFNFQIIGKPKFDQANFSFELEFNLASTRDQNGQIDLNNHFRVVGSLFRESQFFAANVETVGSQPYEKSLLKDGRILILVVPHAQDVYLDITTDLNFHSLGVDSTMQKKIVDSLARGLKSVPDLITGLEATVK